MWPRYPSSHGRLGPKLRHTLLALTSSLPYVLLGGRGNCAGHFPLLTLQVHWLEIENNPSVILKVALTTLVTVKVEVGPQIVHVRRPECNTA